MQLLEDLRSRSYACWPHGCFSHFMEVIPPVMPLETVPTHVGQSSLASSSSSSFAVPTQVGPQAASSSSSAAVPTQVGPLAVASPHAVPTYANIASGRSIWTSPVVTVPLEHWPALSAARPPKRPPAPQRAYAPPVEPATRPTAADTAAWTALQARQQPHEPKPVGAPAGSALEPPAGSDTFARQVGRRYSSTIAPQVSGHGEPLGGCYGHRSS